MPKNDNDLSRFWYVHPKDLVTTQSMLYHENSKLGEFRVRFDSEDPKRAEEMIKVINELNSKNRGYDHVEQIPLKQSAWESVSVPLGNLLRDRRTHRNLAQGKIMLQQLSDLLLFSAGVNGELHYAPNKSRPLRTYPSGGALFSLEVYPVLLNVEDARPGIYYLDVFRPSLSSLSENDYREAMREAFMEDPMIDHASAVLLITAVFPRSRLKYAERAYRFVLLEAGHLAQNFLLTGQALGLSVVPMGGFLDRYLESLLEVDGVEESIVYALIVGTRVPG